MYHCRTYSLNNLGKGTLCFCFITLCLTNREDQYYVKTWTNLEQCLSELQSKTGGCVFTKELYHNCTTSSSQPGSYHTYLRVFGSYFMINIRSSMILVAISCLLLDCIFYFAFRYQHKK